jgi:hypothetical protein
MTDWIYDRQLKRSEKQWRREHRAKQKTLPLAVEKPPKTGDGVTYLSPPYPSRHPVPETNDRDTIPPWEER